MDVLLVLLLGDQGLLVLGHSTSDSSGLLVSQVEGKVWSVVSSAWTRVKKNAGNIHLEFLALYISRTFCLCFWLMTVKTRAMDFRVVLLERGKESVTRFLLTRFGFGFGFRCSLPATTFLSRLSSLSRRSTNAHTAIVSSPIISPDPPACPPCIPKPKPKPPSCCLYLILTSWSTWRPNLQRSSGLATKRAQS